MLCREGNISILNTALTAPDHVVVLEQFNCVFHCMKHLLFTSTFWDSTIHRHLALAWWSRVVSIASGRILLRRRWQNFTTLAVMETNLEKELKFSHAMSCPIPGGSAMVSSPCAVSAFIFLFSFQSGSPQALDVLGVQLHSTCLT